jgi:hypothetical protein
MPETHVPRVLTMNSFILQKVKYIYGSPVTGCTSLFYISNDKAYYKFASAGRIVQKLKAENRSI